MEAQAGTKVVSQSQPTPRDLADGPWAVRQTKTLAQIRYFNPARILVSAIFPTHREAEEFRSALPYPTMIVSAHAWRKEILRRAA